MKNIILAGSSGLVGSFALKNLLSDARIGKIILVSRTSQDISNPKIIQIIGSLDLLDTVDLKEYGVDRIDIGISALGSTLKKAGNKDDFKKIDKDFTVNVAAFSKRFGSKQFAVISALGADSKSPFFYNQVKGEMEEALRALNFSKLTIIRPSLILGERKEVRGAEHFLNKISPFLSVTLIGPLKKYRGIEAHKVADHLTQTIFNETSGVVIIENSEMLNI
ncbi:MAG: NAD(P)H-binding protein [Bacteriovorax sp.]|nr:NAD(P)H-binding protein [Bacteriovorax sp.]